MMIARNAVDCEGLTETRALATSPDNGCGWKLPWHRSPAGAGFERFMTAFDRAG